MLDLRRRPLRRRARERAIGAHADRGRRGGSPLGVRLLALGAAGALLLALGARSAAAASTLALGDLSAAGQSASVAQNALEPRVASDAAGDAVAVWLGKLADGSSVVQAAARPAGGTWEAPADVSAPGFARKPRVAIDATGDAVVVWEDNNVVQASARPAGRAWQGVVDVSAFGQPAADPDVAIDSAGDAVAVWRGGGANADSVVQAAVRPAGGAWQTPINLSAPSQDITNPQVALNAAGDAVAVWQHVNGTWVVQAATRSHRAITRFWQAPVDVSTPGQVAEVPQVALDPAGDAVVVWQHFIVRGSTSVQTVQAASRPAASGAWQTPTDLSAPDATADGQQVALDRAGNAVAVWERDDGTNLVGTEIVQAATRPAGGAWGAPVDVSAPTQVALSYSAAPQLALDQAGDAVTVWAGGPSGANPVVQAASHPASSAGWQAPVDLSAPSQTAERPQVALDQAGDAVAVWQHASDAITVVQAASRPAATGVWQTPVNLFPITAIVPDVIGWSKRFAGPPISAAGLVPRFTGATTATISYVATETPAPRTRVLRGSTVTLYLKPGSPP